MFSLEIKNVQEKYPGQAVDIRYLYHGTRANDPKLIYDGDEGFDLRYAANGSQGHGNYFAVNASYSDSGYIYNVPNTNQKQMFFAKVIVGKAAGAVDANRKMPPFLPGSTT